MRVIEIKIGGESEGRGTFEYVVEVKTTAGRLCRVDINKKLESPKTRFIEWEKLLTCMEIEATNEKSELKVSYKRGQSGLKKKKIGNKKPRLVGYTQQGLKEKNRSQSPLREDR